MEIIRRAAPRRQLPKIEIEAEPFKLKPLKKRLAVWDTETDPFAPGRIVKPFTNGFYLPDTGEYYDFWGDDNIKQFFDFLAVNFVEEDLVILVHNGGNFDFYFVVDYFDDGHKPFIINGRLVRIMAGGQEFRDSYAMMPFALSAYDKIKFDYSLMELYPVCDIQTKKVTTVRELYKEEIRHYQKRDCTALAELVTAWYALFGDKLTIASAALPLLKSYHGFETMSEKTDKEMRPYYFGGRNQCFGTGVLKGAWKIYDIKSSYPNVMRNYKHPISDTPIYEPKITSRTHFAKIRAWSLGALPVRGEDGGLTFPIGTFDFFACIHEIKAGIETNTLRIIKVYHSIYFTEEGSFEGFVDDMFGRRQAAQLEDDLASAMHYKFALNSPYGKLAQDPRKYENWSFNPTELPQPFYCEPCHAAIRSEKERSPCERCESGSHSPYGWYLHTTHEGIAIYASPQKVRASGFNNVATAASITSAARASLLRGLQRAERPVYCDTDSIVCENLEAGNGIVLDAKQLGAWNLEAEGDTMCIAGKKLYALFADGEEVKKASKGVKLTAPEIRRVAEGEIIEYRSPVPKFSLFKEEGKNTVEVEGRFTATWINRNIRSTG